MLGEACTAMHCSALQPAAGGAGRRPASRPPLRAAAHMDSRVRRPEARRGVARQGGVQPSAGCHILHCNVLVN